MEKAGSEPVRVLLTGSEGFIGQETKKELAAAGYEVIPFDLNLGQDLNNPEHLRPLDYDAVIHLGAVSSTPWAKGDPRKAFQTNAYGTYNVLMDAHQKGVKRVVMASSSRLDEMPIDNPYVMSKFLAEKVATQFMDKMDVLVLRFSSVYGPGNYEKTHSPNILNQIVQAAMTGGKVVIFGDGHQKRDFIFGNDVARVMVMTMSTGGNGLKHLGRGQQTSLNIVIRTVEAITNREVKAEYTGSYPPDYMMQQDIESYWSQVYLGVKVTDLKEGIRQCAQWCWHRGLTSECNK